MDHLAFYNAGCEPEPGYPGQALGPPPARKILLPPPGWSRSWRALCDRLDVAEPRSASQVRDQVTTSAAARRTRPPGCRTTIAFGWDYVAMVRRLAVLEEHVDTLLAERDAAGRPRPSPTRPARSRASRAHGEGGITVARSKLG